VSEVSWLAPLAFREDESAFAIRRYDRTESGRIHQEDFAQVLGMSPSNKYAESGKKTSHDHLGRLIRDTCGEEQVVEYIRRLAFVIASGNTDAHLKNWSFLLPSGQRPRLTPLYDQVCVVAWAQDFGWLRPDQRRPELALALGGSRRLSDLSLERFHPLAERLGLPHSDMDRLVKDTLEKIFSALSTVEMPGRMHDALKEHARRVRLLFDFADFG
jgi:serine/threonine-protein kinase HipA